jgi:hypothetical protein
MPSHTMATTGPLVGEQERQGEGEGCVAGECQRTCWVHCKRNGTYVVVPSTP